MKHKLHSLLLIIVGIGIFLMLRPLVLSGGVKFDTVDNSKTSLEAQDNPYVQTVKEDFSSFIGLCKKLVGYTGEMPEGGSSDGTILPDLSDTDSGLTKQATGITSTSKINPNLIEVNLVRVIDGDTVVVSDPENGTEYTVRMIGIDTPESVNPDESLNNEYGQMASDYTKNLLKDVQIVYLEFDVEKADQYGRVLAYVWLKSNVSTGDASDIENFMVNGIILRNGFAVNKTYMPNMMHTNTFQLLRQDAEDTKAGLWSYDGYVDLVEGN